MPLKKTKNPKLAEKELEVSVKRQQIVDDGEAMKRLLAIPEFTRFIELLQEDKDGLNDTLINGTINMQDATLIRERLIARINQIERILKKPGHHIWQMKNLTEVRELIKEKAKQTSNKPS